MLQHPRTTETGATGHFIERRKNTLKRDIVARGKIAGQLNLMAGVEYLQSRGIEARIVRRVLLQLLRRRIHPHDQ